MLRSTFDNIPESIVDQIIDNVVRPMNFGVGQELFDIDPLCAYQRVPIMNQTWSRVVDLKRSSFASVEFTAQGLSCSGMPDTWLQYKLNNVVARGHRNLLKSVWMAIGCSGEHLANNIEKLRRVLHDHVFPSVHSISLCIRSDEVEQSDSELDGPVPATRANIERYVSTLGVILLAAFPRVRYLQTDLTDIPEEYSAVFLPTIYCAYSGTLRRVSLNDSITQEMSCTLAHVPLQFIEINSDDFGDKEIELVRRNAQSLQILRRMSGNCGISRHILADDTGAAIVYPRLTRLEDDSFRGTDHSEYAVAANGNYACHFPQLNYVMSTMSTAPELAMAALAASYSLCHLELEYGDEVYLYLKDHISTPQEIFPSLQYASVNLYSTMHTGDSVVQHLNTFLNIGSQVQHFSYGINHTVREGELAGLSLNLPSLRVLKAGRLEMGIADLLYLIGQLPALYHLTVPYSMDRNIDRVLDGFTDMEVADIRSKLPDIAKSSIQKITLTDACGLDSDYTRILRTNCLLAIAFTKLPLLVKAVMLVHRGSAFPTTAQDVSQFIRRPVFDDSPHIRDIEFAGF